MHGLDWFDYGARHYDAALGRWWSMDPLAEKYSGMSPYVYVGNNPVRFVDVDGEEPRIYIQSKGLGHAFITVKEGTETVIYSYGRYGAIGSSGISGRFTPVGEGVLFRKTGIKASEYLGNVLNEGNFSIYTIKNASDDNVANFFDNLWEKGTRPTDKNKSSYDDENARVIGRYDILRNNCVTITIEGINNDGQKIDDTVKTTHVISNDGVSVSSESKIISPSSLKSSLEQGASSNPNIIKVDNPQDFIQKLQKKLIEKDKRDEYY